MSKPKHRIPWQWCQAHHACRVATRRPWVARILAQHVEHVAEVEADSTHAQERFRVARRRDRRLRLKEEVTDSTAGVEVQPHEAVQGRRRCPQAWYVGGALSQRGLRLVECRGHCKCRRRPWHVHGREWQ